VENRVSESEEEKGIVSEGTNEKRKDGRRGYE